MTSQPPDSSSSEFTIETSPEFKKALRLLKKRYRNIAKDIKPVIDDIQRGKFSGERIAGTGFIVYKVRIQNRDIKKGKRAGYRLIYQIESETQIALLAIYSKSDTTSISAQTIKETIAGMSKPDD